MSDSVADQEPQKNTLSQQVKNLEQSLEALKNCQCGRVRATLMVNFGPHGRTIQGLVDGREDTHTMMFVVLRHYYEHVKSLTDSHDNPTVRGEQ